MKVLKSFLALIAMLAVSTVAFAYNATEHVTVSANKKGDALIYPIYAAMDGVETKFQVVNTSTQYSAVAKVVLSSFKYSQEVRDFLIYLSPNDMFEAVVYYKNGKAYVKTTDDSFCSSSGVCASASAPAEYELVVPCKGVTADSEKLGYISIVELWSSDNITDNAPLNTVGTVDKADIVIQYNKMLAGASTVVNPYSTGFAFGTSVVNANCKDVSGYCYPLNILTGFAELSFPGSYFTAFEPTVLKNYYADYIEKAGLTTYLTQYSYNSVCELESALAKTNVALPYYNSSSAATYSLFTFPTKMSSCPIDPLTSATPVAEATTNSYITVRSEYFYDNFPTDKYFKSIYTLSYYDMSENSVTSSCYISPCTSTTTTFPAEVNFQSAVPSSAYAQGWFKVAFSPASTACLSDVLDNMTFTAAPVLASALHVNADGISFVAPAYDRGAVTYLGVSIPFYAVWDAATVLSE